ncbi:MAG: mechanosensitive ion channel [Gammaproteobacteria bacterium]|jgi:small-conductance mechanosensitive channel|nr:mechanosensitive ion channel [Gammaproteobacteria bacterium]
MKDLKTILETIVFSAAGYEISMGQLILIPLVLLVGYLFLGWVVQKTTTTLTAHDVNPDLVQIVRRAIFVVGVIILVITVLDLINVPLTAFAFVSGAVAIGVGFGAQNIINNFISGWILIWERPIRIDDYIELGGTIGTVEQINTRSTRVRRVDGVHILVPNSKLLEETVVNWTLVDNLLRNIVRVGVQYGSDVEKVRELMTATAESHSLVLDDPNPEVIFDDFGDNALIFDLYFWVHSSGERGGRQIRSDIRFSLDKAFQEAGIVIAFPQRDIHLDGAIRIERE